jgi:hypothetical protein
VAAFSLNGSRESFEMGGGGSGRRAPVSKGNPMMLKDRLNVVLEVAPSGLFALIGVSSPRVTYAMLDRILSGVVPTCENVQVGLIELYTITGVLCLSPSFIYVAAQAADALAEVRGRRLFALPAPLVAGYLSVVSMPIWLAPLVETFGRAALVGADIWWFAVLLSIIALIGAAAIHQAERQGRKPFTALVSATHHLGGAPGIYLAAGLFPRSAAVAEIARQTPLAGPFLAAVLIVTVLIKTT